MLHFTSQYRHDPPVYSKTIEVFASAGVCLPEAVDFAAVQQTGAEAWTLDRLLTCMT